MNEPKDRETKKAERAGKSVLQLLELLHERLDDLDEWREKVDDRLREGDQRFGRIEASVARMDGNMGLVMNSTRTLCKARGLDVERGMLDAALQDWEAARRPNGEVACEVPTNPENERPTDAE